MKEQHLILIAVCLSLVSGVALHLNHVEPVAIVEFIFIENILLLTLQTFLCIRGEDPYLGNAAKEIRRFDNALRIVKSVLEHSVGALSKQNETVQKKVIEFLGDLNASMADLGSGLVKVDLRPGGELFREVHAVEFAKESYWATTCAEPTKYWISPMGTKLLGLTRLATARGVEVTRVFIYPANMRKQLTPAIDRNLEAGVEVFFIDSDNLDKALRRDFALCDKTSIGVELHLDEEDDPKRAEFFIAGAAAADNAIRQLNDVWHQLLASGLAEKISRVLPQSRATGDSAAGEVELETS